ncbi:hypothetical protein HDU78_009216 [Chytriomyces hyalinus]|nr:hypothetical protein HDU78_009216 [Chytriomyces hyalinus]
MTLSLRGRSKLDRRTARLIAPAIFLFIASLVFGCLLTVSTPPTGLNDRSEDSIAPLSTTVISIVRAKGTEVTVRKFSEDPSKFVEHSDAFTSSQMKEKFDTTIVRLLSQDSGQMKDIPPSHFSLNQPPVHDPNFSPSQAILFAATLTKSYFPRHHHLEPTSSTQQNIKLLLKAWHAFTKAQDMHWWIAHDQLLGWFWDAQTPPWSTYLSVQMSVLQLLQLQQFNGTLVDERFRVKVNPAFMLRDQKSPNPIDARFYDVKTGYMIDIEGLSVVRDGDEGRLGCKDGSVHAIQDLMPLHETVLDGVLVWRPRAALKILAQTYGEGILYDQRQSVGGVDYEWSERRRVWVDLD